MCTILLPIKPEYANKILNQTKLYEYRKRKCRRKVEKIVIYSTAPIKKVIAEVEVVEIIANSPKLMWDNTKKYAGISKRNYLNYYNNSDIAVAYRLGKVIIYDTPIELKDLGINYYPQSYVYLD